MKSSKSAPPTTTSRRAFASELLIAAACAAPVVAGCGAGTPLLHPAHALPPGAVTFGAGVSSAFVLGDADVQMDEARQLGAPGAAPSQDPQQEFAEGAIAYIANPPGLAPWVGARAGVGAESDAGVTYFGRSVRVDARHAFEDGDTALSVGLGLTGLLIQPGSNATSSATIPGLDSDEVTGFGADAPVLAGWRSDAQLISVWGGARGGFERMFGTLRLFDGVIPGEPADFEATRWYVGGLFGLSIGVEPVRVAVELDASWSHASGVVDRESNTNPSGRKSSGSVEAWTVVPAGAVVGRF